MRKADYAALAAIIRDGIAFSQVMRESQDATPNNRVSHTGKIEALRLAARQFADCASVNKAEFLRACGIEP